MQLVENGMPVAARMTSASYKVTARVVVQLRAEAFSTDQLARLCIGLLRAPPSPEGGDVREVIGDGYRRQPVEFAPLSDGQRATRNLKTVVLPSVQTWPEASFLAVFDGDDVIAWGRLQTAPGFTDSGAVTFAATAIELSFR